MPNQKNIDQLAILKDKLAKAKSIVFADYHGLSVNDQQELREKVKETAGELTVAKNTLLRLALKDQVGDKLDDALSGPTAVLIATQDEIGPIKAIVEFAQTHKLPKVKAGILRSPSEASREGEDDRILSVEDIQNLAKLPGRMELQAKLVGTLNAPIAGFANVLAGNLRKLVYVLKAVKESKESN